MIAVDGSENVVDGRVWKTGGAKKGPKDRKTGRPKIKAERSERRWEDGRS
jgi:hypothetical protein